MVISFVMTIYKSQGQSSKYVGVYLRQPIFSHDQLYVAFSRVTSRKWLKILVTNNDDSNANNSCNVVYREVFWNL